MPKEALDLVLMEMNPWWEDPGIRPAKEEGCIYRRLLQGKLKSQLLSEDQRAIVLRGPRRVGKTILLIQTAEDILELGDIPLKNLVYFDFSDDRLDWEISPREVVDLCFRSADRNSPRFFLLDEVAKAKDWAAWLKQAVKRKGDRFLVTDSSPGILKEGKEESGVGRWDDYVLEPLSFREFLGIVGRGDVRGESLLRDHPFLLGRYLRLGGFPEHARLEVDQVEAIRRIRDDLASKAVTGDLGRFVGNTEGIRRLFSLLVQESGGIFNASNLNRDFGVSINTFKKWCRLLERSMLLHWLQPWSPKARTRIRKQPKVYAADPGMVSAFHVGGLSGAMAKAFESAVFRHLREAKKTLAEAIQDPSLELFFFRMDNNWEIDFVLAGENGFWALEVTSSMPGKKDFARLLEAGKRLKESFGKRKKARLMLIHGGFLDRMEPEGRALPLGEFLLRPEEILLEEWER